jgi:hypothetical protein
MAPKSGTFDGSVWDDKWFTNRQTSNGAKEYQSPNVIRVFETEKEIKEEKFSETTNQR